LKTTETYVNEFKNLLQNFKISLDEEGILNPQLRWELIKYEIRKFSMYFSKKLARNRRSDYHDMETQINKIENVERWEELVTKHDNLKKRLEEKSNYITEGIIVRSKAIWYELGEKKQ
jgi:hypothetical protein